MTLIQTHRVLPAAAANPSVSKHLQRWALEVPQLQCLEKTEIALEAIAAAVATIHLTVLVLVQGIDLRRYNRRSSLQR